MKTNIAVIENLILKSYETWRTIIAVLISTIK